MSLMITSKLCSRCKVEKPLDSFHKNRARHDGVEPYCRECNNARNREKYAKNPEKEIARTRQYHLDNPEWSKKVVREWHVAHRKERQEKVNQRYATDPDFYLYRRELGNRSNLERRARKQATTVDTITKKDYSKLLSEFNNQCWICEQELTIVYWDHVQPLSKEGAHVIGNLRPSCNPCNSRKSNLWPFTDEMKERIATEVRNLTEVKEVMP